jgi:N-acetylmuramoyl-L-alanine amidase CwlA
MLITRSLISVNFSRGVVKPRAVDQITIHVTEGSAASVRSWFNNPEAKASAHYQVTRAGGIEQFVDEDDIAWHNGRVFEPRAPLVLERPGVNPNLFSIGIEHEGTGRDELTDAQRIASQWLIRDIASRRRIPITRRHVVGHHEVFAKKTCPGVINVDRLVRESAGELADPFAPRVVWSEHLGQYLIVTQTVSDHDWSFVRFDQVKTLPASRAGAPLSQLPSTRPR